MDGFPEDGSSLCPIHLCINCQYLKQYNTGGMQEQEEGKLRWQERKGSGEAGKERKCKQLILQIKS